MKREWSEITLNVLYIFLLVLFGPGPAPCRFQIFCNQVVVFWILHGGLDRCSDISEEHPAPVFRETELMQVDTEVIHTKNCTHYVGQFEGVRPVTASEGREKG
jgi:hypothetical protein